MSGRSVRDSSAQTSYIHSYGVTEDTRSFNPTAVRIYGYRRDYGRYGASAIIIFREAFMKKRRFIFILTALMAVMLAGCGDSNAEDDQINITPLFLRLSCE